MAEDFVATGIPGLDQLLDGKGIPRRSGVFVVGGPGSGKTTFSLQFLYAGATLHSEPGVYISFDEDIANVRWYAHGFGWDLARLEQENQLSLLDASPMRHIQGSATDGNLEFDNDEFTMRSLVNKIREEADRIGARRIVVDPLAMLILRYPDEIKRRNAVLDLRQGVARTRATTMFVSELQQTAIERTYQFEEYLSQGVFLLRKSFNGGGMARIFSVEKMRGVAHDGQPHPYVITPHGIEVHSSESAL